MGMMAAGDQRADGEALAAWAEGLAGRRGETRGRGCLRFAFYGRVSTEDWQDPVTSRARQLQQAMMLIAGRRYLGGRPPYRYRLGNAGPHPNKARGRTSEARVPARGWPWLFSRLGTRRWFQILPTPGSPRTTRARLSPAQTASTSRSSASRSACRSISPVTRARGLGFAVIGPALRRVLVAWLGVNAHTASRLIHHEPDEAKADGSEHLRCHQWRLPLTTTSWPVSESWLSAPP